MPNLSLAPVQSSVAPSQTSELNSELRSFRVNTNFTAASEAGVGRYTQNYVTYRLLRACMFVSITRFNLANISLF